MARLITQDKIDEMYDAYIDKQTAVHVSKACKVSEKTVRKYINDGDPDKGIESFKDRYQKVSVKAQEKSEDKAQIYFKENLALIRKFKGLVAKLLTQIDEFDVSSVTPMKLSMILDSIIKTEAFILGKATEVVKHTHEHVHTTSLKLSPEAMSEVARIVLNDRQEKADQMAIAKRKRAEEEAMDADFEVIG